MYLYFLCSAVYRLQFIRRDEKKDEYLYTLLPSYFKIKKNQANVIFFKTYIFYCKVHFKTQFIALKHILCASFINIIDTFPDIIWNFLFSNVLFDIYVFMIRNHAMYNRYIDVMTFLTISDEKPFTCLPKLIDGK